MSRLIYEEDAIDAIMSEPPEAHYPSWYAEQIKALPSAQPEIIQCKNCKHYHEEECPMRFVEWVTWEEDGYIESDDVVHDYATDDGFCYMGDRREDG